MDAMKNAADFDDEEIIDLTDIIEKGAAPAHKGGDLLDDQLSDLNSSTSDEGAPSIDLDMDADIDALLAQMGGDPSESATSTMPSPPSDAAIPGMGQDSAHSEDVNPHETLDMPGMAEVDSLLQELDMPPQPDSAQASATPDELGGFDDSPASPASAVELDALLDGMLEGTPAPQPVQSPDASGSEPNSALMADLDDLDALLGNGAPADAPAAPADMASPAAPVVAPPAASSDLSLDDLDALFSNDAPADAAPPAPAAPDLFLDDLDALLGNDTAAAPAAPAESASPTPPPAPVVPAAPPSAAADPGLLLDDLDALLGVDTPPASPAAAAAPQPVMSDASGSLNVADLDALLGQAHVPVKADPSYVPDVGDLASLDALLGTAGTPAQEPSPDMLNMLKNFDDTPSVPHAADTPVPTLAEDLMALDVMLDTEVAGKEAPPAQAVQAVPAESSATTRELMDSAPAAPVVDSGLLADLDALLGGASLDTPSPEEVLQTEGTAAPAENDETWRDPLPGFDADAVLPDESASDALLADIDPQELNRAAQELLDEKVMLEATTGDVDTSAWLSSLDEALDEEDALNEAAMTGGESLSAAGGTPEEFLPPAADSGGGTLPENMGLPLDDDAAWPEGIVPSLPDRAEEDGGTGVQDMVPPLPLAAAAALGATAVVMAASPHTPASDTPAASLAAAALSDEDRARISELEERLMALEEQWQTREASHRQLLDHMGTQDLHNSERLSALEARLASVQAEAQAETSARLTQVEFRLDDFLNQPAPVSAPISAEDEELRAARLDLMDGRIMVLEDAEEQRCVRETAAEEHAANMAEGVPADDAEDHSQAQPTLRMLEERLAALESQTSQGQVELEERLTALEGQFRHLESVMEERLEQRAAAAAAKIIREEIAALLVEESK